GVELLFDVATELLRELVELEVHARGAVIGHVPARDLGGVLGEDDAAQRVQRGVRLHEAVAPLPVDLGRNRGSRLRNSGSGIENVEDLTVGLDRVGDPSGASRPSERARVAGLAATARVEDGAVQDDPVLANIE